MIGIRNYLIEKFQVGKDYKRQYTYDPKDRDELIECIKEKVKKEGYGTKDNPLDLNDIDTSKITDMSNLFDANEGKLIELSKTGYFDISDWNVSNVENMFMMFAHSNFDGDLSDWDVSNVKDMGSMFNSSSFTGKNGDISDWDISNVKDMHSMFFSSHFNNNIDKWNVKDNIYIINMFLSSPLQNNPPKWYNL